MKAIQSRSFENKVKKFTSKQKKALDRQIQKILDNPSVGQEKKGDLRGVFVYKFKIEATQYLLSYQFVNNALELIMIGPRENYYRELKTYLKTRYHE